MSDSAPSHTIIEQDLLRVFAPIDIPNVRDLGDPNSLYITYNVSISSTKEFV